MRLRFEKILSLLIEVVYLGIFFFIPLFFAFFLKTTNVFELNKIVLFKILVLLLLFLTVLKIFIYPDKRWLKTIYKNKFAVIPLLFLFILFFITLFSRNFKTSFYGLYDWQEGLVSYAFLIIWFYLLIINVKSREQVGRMIIASAFSSFFVCLYGLIQASGHDFLDWNNQVSTRIVSTLGQPNFLASYLLLVIPVSVYLIFVGKRKFVKFFGLILLFMQLACLFFTYSRAGWLGLVVSIFIFIAFYFWQERTAMKNFISRHYGKISFLFLILIILGFASYQVNPLFKYKIKFDLQASSFASRLDYWRASFDAIKKKPFFGYGLENQGEVFYPYYRVDWGIHNNVNAVPNRAHNFILDIILTTGFFGLFAWIGLYLFFFHLAWKNWQNNDDRALSSALAVGAFAYFISLLFGFSVVATNIYFWGFFALLFILSNLPDDNVIIFESPTAVKTKNKTLVFVKIVALLFLGAVSWKQMDGQVNEIIADHYFREIQLAFINQEYFKSYVLYGYLKETGTKEHFYEQRFGLILADQMDGFREETLIRPGKDLLREILVDIKTENYYDILTRAKIFTALASEREPGYYDLAEVEYEKIIKLGPEMSRSYREIGRMYYKKSDYGKAREYLVLSLEKLPDLKDNRLNKLHKDNVEKERFFIQKLIEEASSKDKNKL